MPLHPQARQLLDQIAAAGRPPVYESTVDEAREGWEALASLAGPGEEVREVVDLQAPGPVGDIPLRLYRPLSGGEGALPALVWIHGGGFVIGSLGSYDTVCRSLCNLSGCVVVSVDYRLAPEHPFPTGVEDCYSATAWVSEHAGELGIDPARLAVGGDSAGGNLSCVVTLLARERGGPPLAFQLLIYPGTDWDLEIPSMLEHGRGHLLERESVRWFRDHYLTDRAQEADWRASPLRAESLAGLPPALVVTAEFDPIRDYGERYAERLRDEGVDVTLHRYDGMIHAFFSLPTVLDDGRAVIEESARALRAALRG